MRILQVVPSLSVRTGGPAVNVVGLTRALQILEASVTVYTTDAATPASAREFKHQQDGKDLPKGATEIDVCCFPVKSPRRFIYSPELRRALARDTAQADLVHIHTLYLYPQFAAWRAARTSNIPYIVSPRGVLDPYLRRRGRARKRAIDALWQRRMLDGAAALHLTSDDERRLVSDLGIKAPHVVVPNGIDVARFERLPSGSFFRDRFLNGSNAPLVLNHGRISEKKGLDILVSAVARVREVHSTALLAIVGPDDEGLAAKLRDQAHQAGIGDAVIFCGMLQGDDLLAALAATDVWALPSHTENFGLAVVEAMAAGRPVVTSPHVNITPDAAAEGALVIADNNPGAVASSIITLLDHPERRDQIGCAGRQFAQRYDWMAVGKQMLELYQTVLERSGR